MNRETRLLLIWLKDDRDLSKKIKHLNIKNSEQLRGFIYSALSEATEDWSTGIRGMFYHLMSNVLAKIDWDELAEDLFSEEKK